MSLIQKLHLQIQEYLNKKLEQISSIIESDVNPIKETMKKNLDILKKKFKGLEKDVKELKGFNLLNKFFTLEKEDYPNSTSESCNQVDKILNNINEKCPLEATKIKLIPEDILSLLKIKYNDKSFLDLNVEIPSIQDFKKVSINPSEINPIDDIDLPAIHTFHEGQLDIWELSSGEKYIVDCPKLSNFPTSFFPSIIIRHFIFISGGKNETYLNSNFLYDILDKHFIQRANLIKGRCSHCLQYCKEKFVYAIGGVINNSIKECEKYEIGNDNWVTIPPLSEGNDCMSCILLDERFIYVFGGYNNTLGSPLASIEKFDIETEIQGWVKINYKGDCWNARYATNVCKISENECLIFGGDNGSYIKECLSFNGTEFQIHSEMKTQCCFYNPLSQPIKFKENIYAIDNSKNLHILNTISKVWEVLSNNEWLQ